MYTGRRRHKAGDDIPYSHVVAKRGLFPHEVWHGQKKSKKEAAQTAYKLSVALSRLMIPHTVLLLTSNSCTQGHLASPKGPCSYVVYTWALK